MARTSLLSRPVALALPAALLLGGGLARVAAVRASTPASAAPVPTLALPDDGGEVVAGERAAGREQRASAATARRAVYRAGDRLAVYDFETGRSTPVAGAGSLAWRARPRFVDASTVSFMTTRGLETADLATGATRMVWSLENQPAYEWTPDRSAVLILVHEFDASPRTLLRRMDVGSGAVTDTVLSPVLPDGFCGVHDPTEPNIAFSPDGSTIMVENPVGVVANGTLFFLDADGTLVGEPLYSAFGRWLPDGRVLAQDLATSDWFVHDPRAGGRTPIGLPENALRPGVSPDGSAIAFDDGARQTGLFVFDVAAGSAARMGSGSMSPVWLSAQRFAAYDTEPCDLCEFESQPTGSSSLFDRDGRIGPLPFGDPGEIDLLRE